MSEVMNINHLAIIKELNDYVDVKVKQGIENNLVERDPYCSEVIKDLNESLGKAQKEYKPVTFNRKEEYLGTLYSDLNSLQNATREALANNNLAVTQFLEVVDEGATILHTRLLHASGQWIETRSRVSWAKDDLDSYESNLCSHKRLSYMAITGITPSSDKGDDGNEKAMRGKNNRIAIDSPSDELKLNSGDVISKKELRSLEDELEGFTDLAVNILNKYHINSLAELPASAYKEVWTRVLSTKKLYK